MLINWDGGSIERGMLNHRQGLAPADMVCMIEEIVDEHARAGVDTYVHVVFAQFRANLSRLKLLQTVSRDWKPDCQEELDQEGIDLTGILIDRCRYHGIPFLACLRMNDRHSDSVEAEFWKAHPEWRLEAYRGGLDYRHEGVRDTLLAFIDELLGAYDLDGLEFDYMRWCHVFDPAEAEGHAGLLTEMTAQTRARLDACAAKGGRDRMPLGVRIPQTLEECRALGFDVATWVKQGLVDYLVPSDFFCTDLNTPVEDFVALTKGTLCRVYPAIHPLIGRGYELGLMESTHYRAAAHNFYARGAHGLSPYNYMYTWDKRRNPWYMGSGLRWPAALGTLRELSDLEQVRRHDRHYLFHTMWDEGAPTGADKDCRIHLDAAQPTGMQRFRLCEDLTDSSLRAVLQFKADGLDASDDVEISLNGRTVPSPRITRVAHPEGQTKYEGRPMASFALFLIDFPRGENPPMLLDGDNELSVTWCPGNSGGAVTVDELEVYVYVSDDLRPDVGQGFGLDA